MKQQQEQELVGGEVFSIVDKPSLELELSQIKMIDS